MGEELGDALDLIEFREEIGWPPDRGPAMAEQPSPDELAEAERYVREYINACVGGQTLRELRKVMAEFDRLRLVEQAAREYMLSCLCNGGTDSPELNADINTKFGALLDAMRTNGEFRG
jgi:hypothetical protein